MPTRLLPNRPSLLQLKQQAADLRKSRQRRDPAAAQRIREFHPKFLLLTDDEIFGAKFIQSDALLSIAREYGFSSWPKLKAHVESGHALDQQAPLQERIEDPDFKRALEMADAGDEEGLRRQIKRRPSLLHARVLFEGVNYFRSPSLLEFIAENPVRRGSMPENVTSIARLLIEAGAGDISETLRLVSSGSVARECEKQAPLIKLLCSFGADPNAGMRAALVHSEGDAVRLLLECGAAIDLPVASATGDVGALRATLPAATPQERLLALSLAAQYGQPDSIRELLAAGESPDRYSPVGAHSHSTPLHQAVWGGHLDAVKAFVDNGAKLDMHDILFGGTPLGLGRARRQVRDSRVLARRQRARCHQAKSRRLNPQRKAAPA